MELHHEFSVPADIDQVWETLLDLERVGGCFPGATVTEASDEGFSGTVKVKLGPISLVYAGSGTFVERDDSAHRAVIDAKGKDKRGNGTAGATVTMELAEGPDGPGSTQVSVDTDLAITGKPAQFGRGVMQDVSDKLLMQFVDCIQSQFDEPADEPVDETGDESAESGAGAGDVGSTDGASAAAGEAVTAGTSAPGATGDSAGAAAAAAGSPSSTRAASGASPSTRSSRHAPKVDDAIDLGAVALPSVVKQWGPYAVGALVGLFVGWCLGRRRS